MVFRVSPYNITEKLITYFIDLFEKSMFDRNKDGVIQHIDMVVFIVLTETVGGCFRVDP